MVKTEHLHEKRTMNCGMEAEIIEYRSYQDIDVKFSDGTVVEKKSYKAFKHGNIKNNNYRIGEEKIMLCGMKAKIAGYRNSKDCDILFEDGTLVTNKMYQDFTSGYIRNPNISQINDRTGETLPMKCGMDATIVVYRSSEDIDILINGEILEHRSYYDFKNRTIWPKGLHHNHVDFTGYENFMNCGLYATVIKSDRAKNMVVEYEDGTIKNNVCIKEFRNGSTCHPLLLMSGEFAGGKYKRIAIDREHKKTYYRVTTKDIDEIVDARKLLQIQKESKKGEDNCKYSD